MPVGWNKAESFSGFGNLSKSYKSASFSETTFCDIFTFSAISSCVWKPVTSCYRLIVLFFFRLPGPVLPPRVVCVSCLTWGTRRPPSQLSYQAQPGSDSERHNAPSAPVHALRALFPVQVSRLQRPRHGLRVARHSPVPAVQFSCRRREPAGFDAATAQVYRPIKLKFHRAHERETLGRAPSRMF